MNYRKILIYTGLVAGVLILSLAISVFLFKDKIIRSFITEANKHLNTPIKVGKIDVSVFTHFPNISILMSDVYVEDSHSGQYPLLTAGQISFQLNPLDVYRGTYNIQGLDIRDSETNLKINEDGKNNYTILKPVKDGGGSAVNLELKNVSLSKTRVTYIDVRARLHYIFVSDRLRTSIKTVSDVYHIRADGQLTTESISIEGNSYMAGKSFMVESDLDYDDNKKSLLIKPSILKLKSSSFSVAGNYEWNQNTIDLTVKGTNTDIQTLLSLFPETTASQFEKYRSEGDVFFSAHLKGAIADQSYPALSVDFGFNDATIFHPDYDVQFEKASMKGVFTSDDLIDRANATLALKNIEGRLKGESFTGKFLMRDFRNPYVEAAFNGKMDAAALNRFYPLENVGEVSGSLIADVAFRGEVELLRSKATANQVATRGTVDLQDISFIYGKDKVPVRNLKGSLQFSSNDLALSNVSGVFGNSDFLVNGFFKNIITYLFFENQPIGIEADLVSDHLDANQLFALGYATDQSSSPKSQYEFAIPESVNLNFNCEIRHLVYKKFNAQQIKGDLLVKNRVAVSRNLSFKTMGGSLTLSGIVDATNPKAIDVVCTSDMTGINIDSAFYVFDNFDQDFIQDKHLKGKATATVNLEMALNQNLDLFQETLVADISAVIRNGELNNFEPLKKLNKYLDDEGLARLRFSDLQNNIHIENKTVYIPQMDVRSNVTDIRISGTHTFDQRIDYRVQAPLRGKKSVSDPQFAGSTEKDASGQTRIFLKITGTTDDYKVGLDGEGIRKKIVSDIKKEAKELKDIFKKKEAEKVKELELEEDEYFDW